MTAADRPWWATEGEVPPGGRPDPDEDPLAAHRAARRGDRNGSGEVWWVPAVDAVTRFAREVAAGTAPPPADGSDDGPHDDGSDDGPRPAEPTHTIEACGVCPICVGLRALGEARPELVGHLAEAARQLALAVRTVVDAAVPTDDPPGPSGPSRHDRDGDDLQRIDLDG